MQQYHKTTHSMSYPDPYGYYGGGSGGYPPAPGAPYYGGYQPPPPAGYPYGAPPPAGYPSAYPPAPAAPYGGYYPPPPQHHAPPPSHYDYPPPPAHHSPPPQAAPPPAREGELRPPPDVGVDPNSFRRFFSQELHKLTYNSKPVITALTLFAHEHSVRMSGVVAQCLEEHIRTVSCAPLLVFSLLSSPFFSGTTYEAETVRDMRRTGRRRRDVRGGKRGCKKSETATSFLDGRTGPHFLRLFFARLATLPLSASLLSRSSSLLVACFVQAVFPEDAKSAFLSRTSPCRRKRACEKDEKTVPYSSP